MILNAIENNSISSYLINLSASNFSTLLTTLDELFSHLHWLVFTMPQVSGIGLHKQKKCLQKVKVLNLIFSERVRY